MRRQVSICDTVVKAIKIKISSGLSIQAIARNTGVAYWTIRCIRDGKYDIKEPLHAKEEVVNNDEMFFVGKYENWLM